MMLVKPPTRVQLEKIIVGKIERSTSGGPISFLPVGSMTFPVPVLKVPLNVPRGLTKYQTLFGSIGSSQENPKAFCSMSGKAVLMSAATPFTEAKMS